MSYSSYFILLINLLLLGGTIGVYIYEINLWRDQALFFFAATGSFFALGSSIKLVFQLWTSATRILLVLMNLLLYTSFFFVHIIVLYYCIWLKILGGNVPKTPNEMFLHFWDSASKIIGL